MGQAYPHQAARTSVGEVTRRAGDAIVAAVSPKQPA
jgi:hypothetical protein